MVGFPQLRLRALQRDPLGALRRLQRAQGDLACFWLGRQRCYYVATPELVEELFVQHREDIGKRSNVRRWWRHCPPSYVRGELFFTHDEGDHAQARKHFNQTFSTGHALQDAARSSSIMERIFEEEAGQRVELLHLVERVSVTAGITTLFGREPDGELVEEIVRLGADARELSVIFASNAQMKLQSLLHPRRTVKVYEAYASLTEICQRFLAEHPEERPTALSARLRQWPDLSAPARMTVLMSVAPLLDSVAPPIAFALLAAAADPALAAQVAVEVDALGGAPLTGETLGRLPAACAAADESLRFCPTWNIGRVCQRPFTSSGHRFQVGDWLLASPALLHHDERYWAEPERFSLERWSSEQVAARPKYAYMPFGFGNRICPGRNITTTTIALAVAVFCRDWRLELETAPPAWGPTKTGDYAPNAPVYGRLVPRQPATAAVIS